MTKKSSPTPPSISSTAMASSPRPLTAAQRPSKKPGATALRSSSPTSSCPRSTASKPPSPSAGSAPTPASSSSAARRPQSRSSPVHASAATPSSSSPNPSTPPSSSSTSAKTKLLSSSSSSLSSLLSLPLPLFLSSPQAICLPCCHPRRGSASLSVIPVGDLRLSLSFAPAFCIRPREHDQRPLVQERRPLLPSRRLLHGHHRRRCRRLSRPHAPPRLPPGPRRHRHLAHALPALARSRRRLRCFRLLQRRSALRHPR